jgi:hypothetical protein
MLMRAVAIKNGQGQEKAAGFEEMGTLRCDGCGEEFYIVHIPRSRISGSLRNKHIGSKRFLLKSTSATRSTPTELNCRSDPQIMDRKSIARFPL